MPSKFILKKLTLGGVAVIGGILTIWGSGIFSAEGGLTSSENGMGGPAEAPLAIVLPGQLPGLASSFVRAPDYHPLALDQRGPVDLNGDRPVDMVIQPRQTFYEALEAHGVAHEDIMAVVTANQGFRNLKKVRTGEIFRIMVNDDGGLESLAFDLDEESYVTWTRQDDGYERIDGSYPVEKKLKAISGTINNSLYATLQRLDAPLALAPKMNDILGWDLDFNRDLRKGDKFSILYEEVYKDGKRIRTGSILGVEIINRGKSRQAFLFKTTDERSHYYNAEGKNLQKQLLRAPLNYSRISSKFSYNRFHPVLKRNMPHLGVDYAAPNGTPVKAAGDGVVVARRSKKGNGRYIQIRHTNASYETYYLHLSRFAKGLEVGSKVTQGEVIGYVGATGYATGPHLDFRVKRDGKFVNPRTLKLPAAKPVSKDQLASFKSQAQRYMSVLADLPLDAAPVELPPLAIAKVEETMVSDGWQGPVQTTMILPDGVRSMD